MRNHPKRLTVKQELRIHAPYLGGFSSWRREHHSKSGIRHDGHILTDKEVRYAMIKGWVERKHPEKRPASCFPNVSVVSLSDVIDTSHEEINEEGAWDYYTGGEE